MIPDEIRPLLSREYGFKHQGSLIVVRIPRASVFGFSSLDVFKVYNIIKKKSFKTIYILADKSYIKIDRGMFSELVNNRISIEEILRGGKKFEISDFYRDSIRKLLDEASTPTEVSKTQMRGGRRTEIVMRGGRGRAVRYRMPEDMRHVDVALIPTIKASAIRGGMTEEGLKIKNVDLREKIRRRHVSASIAIVCDASSSVDDGKKRSVITAVLRLILVSVYERRDEVALIPYRGENAKILVDFTSDVSSIDRFVQNLQIGGTTPLSSGIYTGLNAFTERIRATAVPVLVLITDGTMNVPMMPGVDLYRELLLVCKKVKDSGVKLLIFDIDENGSILAKRTAVSSDGIYHHLKFDFGKEGALS